MTVKYTLKESELLIEYTATTDKTTLWCPTNHTYFNLDGESSGDCLDNVLQINSERITLMNDELITTGEVKYVHNTPYDFTMSKRIGRDIYSAELDVTKGYDSNYILSEPTFLDDGQSKTEEESKDPLYPLYKQIKELQKKNQHAIVVAHLGDFYEVIGEKAKAVSEEFSLILKYRDNPTRKWCIYTIK